MSPIIHCVRHAQGFHNLSEANHSMRDPMLTPFGQQQCQTLQHDFPHHDTVELVVASALKRTIYTALYSFEDIIKTKGLTVIAMPELQETSDLPCDTGSPPEELAKEFAGKPVDLSLVTPDWVSKRGRWAPEAEAVEQRALDARNWLAARPEKEIVVVSHGAFLHYFTEDWTGSDKFCGTGWANTEFRSFTFDSAQESEQAHLVETALSRERRLEREKPLNILEQAKLKSMAEDSWGKDGYVQKASAQQQV